MQNFLILSFNPKIQTTSYKLIYDINTNEIPNEVDICIRENNILSSHVKRSPLLELHNKSYPA